MMRGGNCLVSEDEVRHDSMISTFCWVARTARLPVNVRGSGHTGRQAASGTQRHAFHGLVRKLRGIGRGVSIVRFSCSRLAIIFTIFSGMITLDAHGGELGTPGVPAPPIEDGPFLRPAAVDDAEPIWGIKGGIAVGLWPNPGPRGLIRVYTPYLGQPRLTRAELHRRRAGGGAGPRALRAREKPA